MNPHRAGLGLGPGSGARYIKAAVAAPGGPSTPWACVSSRLSWTPQLILLKRRSRQRPPLLRFEVIWIKALKSPT